MRADVNLKMNGQTSAKWGWGFQSREIDTTMPGWDLHYRLIQLEMHASKEVDANRYMNEIQFSDMLM